jgi:fructose-1,6-bisphosphatase II
MKNLHLDLVRVTEAGAISAAEWVGRGNKEEADRAATDAMRDRLGKIEFVAEIAIGEGKKDESFGLFKGEMLGLTYTNMVERLKKEDVPILPGSTFKERLGVQAYSIAVDPIEGTTPTAKGGYEAMSVIALGSEGCFYDTEEFYMEKFAVGPKVAKSNKWAGLQVPIESNIAMVADALDKSINHVTVCMLDRPRHNKLVERIRAMGCRIKFISDCDVTACIATCVPDSGIDMYVGVGGAPEAMIAAAAMKCMKGKFQARLADKDGNVIEKAKIFEMEELAKGDVMFCATGITNGQLLRGVQFTSHGPVTHSIAMRSESGTIREIKTTHGN